MSMKLVLAMAGAALAAACSSSSLPTTAGRGMNPHADMTASALSAGAYDEVGVSMKPLDGRTENWRLEASAAPTH